MRSCHPEGNPGSVVGVKGILMAQNKAVVIVGSCNMDLVVKAPRIPVMGETILGGEFLTTPVCKGANQAGAAARLGSKVHFVARIGEDAFGDETIKNLKNNGVNTEHVVRSSCAPTGVALIVVDHDGNNSIVVAPGANAALMPEDVDRAESAIASSSVLVTQLETPIATAQHSAKLARRHGVRVILDPAPAQELSDELLGNVDILTPNETEARILTGIEVDDADSAAKAARTLLDRGTHIVVLTMSKNGLLLVTQEETRSIAAKEVKAVDTTAAGDAFTGSLACGLAEGMKLAEVVEFASCAAALSVTKMGAQSSLPNREDVNKTFGIA